MRNGVCFGQRHFNEVLLPIHNAFLHGPNDITRLTDADAHLAFFISNDDDRPETQLFTAFDNLRDSTDLDDPFLPFRFLFAGFRTLTTFRHFILLLEI